MNPVCSNAPVSVIGVASLFDTKDDGEGGEPGDPQRPSKLKLP